MVDKDITIIGSGGAGISAAIYAIRYRMDYLLLGDLPGGTLTTANLVENYPGYSSILGPDLVTKFVEHLEYLGGKITPQRVQTIQREGDKFLVTTDQEVYRTKTVVYALGSSHRHLGAPGENEFEGRGVSYCATCDGFFFRDKTVAVIGGGDSAATGALVLGNLAQHTYMIVRKPTLRAEPIWVEQLTAHPKITIIYDTNVTEIKGSTRVEEVLLDRPFQEKNTLKLDGVFIEIGQLPNSKMAADIGVELDPAGYIQVGEDMSTNIPGFYAAGDVTTGSARFMQLVTAASEGVISVYSSYKYLNSQGQLVHDNTPSN